ncbi:outer membrane beta-barrel protein [Algoriphagus halophytocola]|uniref:Outer membrane beta-barrel protein n=1 Tax=Algoriphagus halophytocola TaxID=2991499 RepID=A0ABY6MLK2_9BACT|nr:MULTISPECIES: outer membrane beta-barrel protein [unclassified Algoriphagus]UZD24424.1 outer membrane beta-barrel protein [Algoriphagus sp. TR-M5]WBL41788.1 outer membrane beta-barrel protein [Algoriphagus sp. TR-M9]
MKYLGLILFLIPYTASAQFSKGTVVVGGSMSYSSQTQNITDGDYPASSYLSLSPTIGVFVSPTVSVNVLGQVYSQKNPTINVITNLFETEKSVSQIYGLLVRKYFPLSDKFLLSLNGKAGAGSRIKNEDSDTKTSQLIISISPALTFIPHKNWGIEGGFGQISYEKNSQQNPYYDSDQFKASLGELGLGVNYYFNRKN